MQKFYQLPKPLRWLIVIIPFVIVIAVLIFVLVGMLIPKKYEDIILENPQVISDKISSGEMKQFRYELLYFLEPHYVAEGTVVSDIYIRSDSVASFKTYDSAGDYNRISFLIDIDSIQQTFEVNILSTDVEQTDSKVKITCPKVSESKFPDSVCDDATSIEMLPSVKNYLPHEMALASGEKVLVKKIIYKSGIQLEIYLYSCDEKNPPMEETKELVKKWVEEIGDERNYNYNVRTGYCEGDTI